MTTQDDLYQQYEKILVEINCEAHKSKERARVILREKLKELRDAAHEELKSIRIIEQRTRR